MQTQSTERQTAAPTHASLRLVPAEACRLGRLGGELRVLEGRVWLTRRGKTGDHVLNPGEQVRLAVDDDAVIESYDAGRSASVRFSPRRRGVAGALLELPLRGFAVLTAMTARAFVALALVAAASARRAQGRIA